MTETKKKVKKKKEKKPAPGAVDVLRFPKKVRHRQQMPRGDHRGMELLLIEDVPNVGKQGELVEVKPGFGRNFLLPHGLATFATPEAKIRIERHKAKVEAIKIAKLSELKVLAKKLAEHSVTIEANANEEGHLYGSVTAIDIVRVLAKDNYVLTEDQVRLEGPLKELGLYNVLLHLADEVDTEVKVWVVPTASKET